MKIKNRLLQAGTCLFGVTVLLCVFNGILLPFGFEVTHFSRPIVWLCFAGMTGLSCLVFIRIEQMEQGRATRLAAWAGQTYTGVFFILSLLLGYWMEYTPSGDNFMLYQASQTLAREGCFEVGSDFLLYFGRYSNQWGFLLILTGVYRFLFAMGMENSFYPIVVLQAVLYVLAFRSLFRIALRYCGGQGKLKLIYLLITCFPMVLAPVVLYTDTFSMSFVVFTLESSLHVLDADRLSERIRWAILSGVLAFLGGQIKMTVMIVLIAAGLVWFLRLPVKQAVLCIGLVGSIIWGGMSLVHQYMLGNVLDPTIYRQEHTPVIHWIMMSIPSADNPYGGYYSRDYAITWGMMDEGADHETVMASIYSRMKDKIYTLRYPNRLLLAIFRKNSASMSDGTFGMTEMLDDRPVRWNLLSEIVLEPGRWYHLYGSIVTGIWMAQLCLAGLDALKNRLMANTYHTVLHVAGFGIILFLMIWEARSRYLFGYVPLFLLTVALSHGAKGVIMEPDTGRMSPSGRADGQHK